MLAPIVEELAAEYAGKVKVAKLNTDDSPNTAAKFNISAIPSMLFFKGGQVEKQMVGVHSKADLKKILDELVGSNA
jgi:thioredoxin 1